MLKPKNCEVILNSDCNAKCVFCYQPGPGREEPCGRMPFDKAAQALYAGRRDGCWVAYLIGGEITMREDLPRIVRLARGMGYAYVQVMTNGLKLADRAYARTLVDAGANIFRISVHGHNAELHDGLVGVPGAFKKVLKAFGNIRALGAEISANHAINSRNYRTVTHTLELLSGKFGIEDFNIIFPHYNGMMARNAASLKVSVTQAAPYLREGLAYLKKSKAVIEDALFINFCPCNLPEAEHLMSEWERPAGPAATEPVYFLEGGGESVYDLKSRLRVKNRSCRDCVYGARCMGFEKWYADVYGASEFKPVRKAVRPFPLFPSHGRMRRAEALFRGRGS